MMDTEDRRAGDESGGHGGDGGERRRSTLSLMMEEGQGRSTAEKI